MATTQQRSIPTREPRERRPSTGAPIVDIQGSVGPAGISRPKHKRTATGFGPGEIKNIEGKLFPLPNGWIYMYTSEALLSNFTTADLDEPSHSFHS